MRRLMVMIPMVAMMGCSGSMSGTVGGVSMNVADSIFAILKDDNGKSFAAIVVLADQPKICDSLKANREPKSSTALQLTMLRVGSNEFLAPDVGEYTTVGTVPSSPGSYAVATFSHTDSNCTNTLSDSASSGKSGLIKLTTIKGETNGTASGTYDITFGAGDTVKGSFNASFCDLTKLPATTPNCQ